jgi:hypothetical protein
MSHTPPADLVFGACNSGAPGETLLVCSVLDPVRDERTVRALLELGDFRARLAAGAYTLRGPRKCEVGLMRGPRAGQVQDLHGIGPDDEARIPIGRLGPTSRADVEAMLAEAGLLPSFDLPPERAVLILGTAEVRQMILRVTPTGHSPRSAFLAVVKHWGDRRRRRFIGSFAALFC